MPKTCIKCGALHDEAKGKCRACIAQYHRDRRERLRPSTKQCAACGEEKPNGSGIPVNGKYCYGCRARGDDLRAYVRDHYATVRKQRDAWAAENKDAVRASRKEWKRRNPESVQRHRRDNYVRNQESRCAYTRDRWATDAEYRAKQREHRARRQRFKESMVLALREHPEWVADMAAIYRTASMQGVSVDHIVPLRHPNVCGLHAPWNLQLIPLEENMSKKNRLPPEDQLVAPGPYQPAESH